MIGSGISRVDSFPEKRLEVEKALFISILLDFSWGLMNVCGAKINEE